MRSGKPLYMVAFFHDKGGVGFMECFSSSYLISKFYCLFQKIFNNLFLFYLDLSSLGNWKEHGGICNNI